MDKVTRGELAAALLALPHRLRCRLGAARFRVSGLGGWGKLPLDESFRKASSPTATISVLYPVDK